MTTRGPADRGAVFGFVPAWRCGEGDDRGDEEESGGSEEAGSVAGGGVVRGASQGREEGQQGQAGCCSVKLRDVRRDPRVAIHSPTLEPPEDSSDSSGEWPGDAKLAGTLVEIDATSQQEMEHPGAGFFRLDIHEVVLTYVGTPADHLVIESWHPDRGWQRRQH